MQLFGYFDDGLPIEDVRPRALAELTLNASPDELRALAQFLSACADEMDVSGEKFGHWHLADRVRRFSDSPHFVVFRAESSPEAVKDLQ